MASQDEPLIDMNDFKSIRLLVGLLNNVTQTEVKIPKYRKGEEPPECKVKFLEMDEERLKLSVPPKTCAQGHNLTITIQTVNAKADVTFVSTVKVEKLSHQKGEEFDDIWVTLVQYDETSYLAFRSIFETRQQEIEQFFQAVRGY